MFLLKYTLKYDIIYFTKIIVPHSLFYIYIYTKEYVEKQVEKEDFVRFVIDSLARKFSFSEFLLIIESVF